MNKVNFGDCPMPMHHKMERCVWWLYKLYAVCVRSATRCRQCRLEVCCSGVTAAAAGRGKLFRNWTISLRRTWQRPERRAGRAGAGRSAVAGRRADRGPASHRRRRRRGLGGRRLGWKGIEPVQSSDLVSVTARLTGGAASWARGDGWVTECLPNKETIADWCACVRAWS